MDRCALFVDAGYALADGAMAVHGTRRRDSVSWDHAGLLKLLAGLARDRTGLPVLRCYWYETAEGRRTAEHDALAEMPGLKLRLVNTRPGRREGIESQFRRDLVTLAKSGAITDAFIASADEHLAEIVAEVQDLGLRVVILHIASDGGWTIPQPLRQECDDIVEISGVHLRPFVDLIRGAEPATQDEQYAASFSARAIANSDGPALGAMAHTGLQAAALPAPVGAYSTAAGSDYGTNAQPYGITPGQAGSAAVYQGVSAAAQTGELVGLTGSQSGHGASPVQRGADSGSRDGQGSGVAQHTGTAQHQHAGAPQHAAQSSNTPSAGIQVTGGYGGDLNGSGIPQHAAAGAGTGQHAGQGAGVGQHAGQGNGVGQHAAHVNGVGQHAGQSSGLGQRAGLGSGVPPHAGQGNGIAQHAAPAASASAGVPQNAAGQGGAMQSGAAQDGGAGTYGHGQAGDRGAVSPGTSPSIYQNGPASGGPGSQVHAVPVNGSLQAVGSVPQGQMPYNMMPQNSGAQNASAQNASAQNASAQNASAQNAAAQNGYQGDPGSNAAPEPEQSSGYEGRLTQSGVPGGYQSAALPVAYQGGSGQGGISPAPPGYQGGQASSGYQHSNGFQGGQASNGYPGGQASNGSVGQSGTYQSGNYQGGVTQGGMTQPGLTPNGLPVGGYQGSYQSGPSQNGPSQDGPSDGAGQNGHGQDGAGQDAHGQGGPGQNGSHIDSGQNGSSQSGSTGSYQNGSGQNGQVGRYQNGGQQAGGAPNGGAVNGGALNGNVLNGGALNGGAPSGSGLNGGALNGGALNGSGYNGAVPGSYQATDQRRNGVPAGAAGFEAAPTPGQQASGQPAYGQPSAYGVPDPAFFQGQPGGYGQQARDAYVPSQAPGGPSFQPQYPAQSQPVSASQAVSVLPAVRTAQPVAISLSEAVKAAHSEGFAFGESVGRDAPGLWLEAVLARKPRMPSDLEARLLQGSVLPIDSLLHDEVRHSLRRGFWDALESARR